MDEITKLFEFPIDYEGQKLANDYTIKLSYANAILAALIGFLSQDILLCVYTFGIGVIFSLLVAVPSWPIYNQNPVQWLQINFFDSDVKLEATEEDPTARYTL